MCGVTSSHAFAFARRLVLRAAWASRATAKGAGKNQDGGGLIGGKWNRKNEGFSSQRRRATNDDFNHEYGGATSWQPSYSYAYDSIESQGFASSFSYTDMDPAALFGQFDGDGSASLNLGEFQVLLNSALSDGGPDYPMEFVSCAFNFLDTQGRCWRAFTHAGDIREWPR